MAVGAFPLTDAQAEKWLGSQYSPQAAQAFVEAFELAFEGDLDPLRLQSAIDAVLARHQAFALRFEADGSAQVHVPDQRLRVPYVDLSGLSDPPAEYAARCKEDRARPFDLSAAPLVRACLYRLAPRRHRLFMAAHHLVVDGWSLRVVLGEIAAHYNAAAAGQEARLPEADSWADFVHAERARRDGAEGRRCLEWWLAEFSDVPEPLPLPTDRPRGPRIAFDAGSFTIDVDPELWQGLRQASRAERVTRFSLLLAGYFALLHRLCGQEDLVCGVPFAGAARGSGARLAGDTDNTLPIRVRVDPAQPLRALALQVQRKLRDAAAHQDVSLGRIVDGLRLRRDAGRMLLVDAIVALVPSFERLSFAGVDCRLDVLPRTAAAWETAWYWRPGPGTLQLEVQFQTGLYDASTLQAWARTYLDLLRAVAAGDPTPLSGLDLVGAPVPGLHMLANDLAPAGGAMPSLPALLAPAFREHATRCAAECGDDRIDYATLDKRSARLAAALLEAGVGRGELVGVWVPRSIGMLVAVLAVMRAGAAYVPLDPAFPEARLQRMADHSGLARIVTGDGARLPASLSGGRTLLPMATLQAGRASRPLPEPGPDDPAYVLYTSGSTGNPKGVRILHRNLVNFLCAMREAPGFSRDDAICAATTLSFDIAALELFLPLACGGRVVIADEGEHRDPRALCDLIRRRGCTVFQTTPSTLALVVEQGRGEVLAPLRLLVGGEALPLPLARTLAGGCRELWNMYGPTETTVWSSIGRIEPGVEAVTLGQPIARTRLYLLDEDRRPALPRAIGEIWIGGAGVADGYLHDPGASAAAFVPDPFAADGSRMYRTGDLGRLHEGGLAFQGRADGQIKLRGYRIEPGEIEAVAAAEPGVGECVAVVRRIEGDDALVLYVAGRRPPEELVPALRARLQQALPAYMRPQYVEVLAGLPKTPNGKIDRRALPAPSAQAVARPDRRPPGTALERELCDLWRQLLRSGPIGVDDDFFALGGSSLLAVRMFATLQRRHGVALPLATLIECPTVATLAATLSSALDAQTRDPSRPPTPGRPLLLRAGHGGPPLFLFHAVGGNVLNYQPLAEAMDPRLPVYGLQSAGLEGGAVPCDDLAAMADAYAAAIQAVHAQGPLLLAGGSMGGLVALEVARRLQSRGRQVALLAMFDTGAPATGIEAPRLSMGALRGLLEGLGRPQVAEVARRARARLLEIPWGRLRAIGRRGAPEPLVLRLRRIEVANRRALAAHVPRRYAGDVVLLRTPVRPGTDATLGWDAWIDGTIHVDEVPGHHHDVVARPELAERLRWRIARALEQAPSGGSPRDGA